MSAAGRLASNVWHRLRKPCGMCVSKLDSVSVFLTSFGQTQTECIRGRCFTNTKCGNQRMQRNVHAAMGLQLVEGKGIALISDTVIEKDELVAQYVGEVLSREMYIDRERRVRTIQSPRYHLANSTCMVSR